VSAAPPVRNTQDAPTPGRVAALETLRAVREGNLADRALERAARKLDARDRAFTHELVYGTFRLRARLDHILAAYVKRTLDDIEPELLDILRLGAYQLLEMNGVPSYAAVSQSVELAKRSSGSGGGGFVNGVLQSLRRNPDAAKFAAFEDDPVEHLSTWGSHPRWLVERWIARYGADGAREITESDNTRPDLYVRALTEDAARLLEEAGVATEPVAFSSSSLRITNGTVTQVLGGAPVVIQDPAATLVATYADDGSAQVLDLAAAPGGKAIVLAAFVADQRFVAAADVSWHRTARIRDNVRRLHAQGEQLPISLVVADARSAPFRKASLVLLDAPCTGTGTLRRHPDGRWRVTPDDLAILVTLQAELLDAAAGLVQPGGLLAYATCSLEPEENEMQVASFLSRHDGFVVERSTRVDSTLLDADGSLRVLPHVHGVDGAFCALLRKA